jgi:hypothetical protein
MEDALEDPIAGASEMLGQSGPVATGLQLVDEEFDVHKRAEICGFKNSWVFQAIEERKYASRLSPGKLLIGLRRLDRFLVDLVDLAQGLFVCLEREADLLGAEFYALRSGGNI